MGASPGDGRLLGDKQPYLDRLQREEMRAAGGVRGCRQHGDERLLGDKQPYLDRLRRGRPGDKQPYLDRPTMKTPSSALRHRWTDKSDDPSMGKAE